MNAGVVSPRGLRAAVFAAETGTVLLAAGAFVLSFTTLRDLAERSGLDPQLAWLWPLIVDGIIIVATISVFALAGTRVVWYPWMLLILGAGVSVAANAIHAVMAAAPGVSPVLAGSVASVPPIVLVASTHLTALLIRHSRTVTAIAAPDEQAPDLREAGNAAPTPRDSSAAVVAALPLMPDPSFPEAHAAQAAPPPLVPLDVEPDSRRELAAQLRGEGLTNAAIARLLGVNRSTVGRWLPNLTEQEIPS